MTTNYLQMMIDSLNKKKKILTRIVELQSLCLMMKRLTLI